ncbi:F0F1 ATP synthase subunit A [Halomonas sp. HP20-15]|uniref:F0F1 ATP synthase subunit A n=1 Tax=Halomonas sp. HP20-15 TaxID=3085901 RepID=UPI0029819767|nr:F0F1 ATP synthase subunit A [Halomonas sp. HP20-15]MDW5375905.1 F0F1 ATP synthase subunit A [Halomonas sp. HP20-15]
MSSGEILKEVDSVQYIQHHLQNWSIGEGFWALNLDTLILSWLLAGGAIYFAWRVGRQFTTERPGRIQNFLESVVEFVNVQSSALFPQRDPLVGPLALTIFIWVFLMNFMDLIPVDLLPLAAQWVGSWFGADPHHVYFRAVPTADLSMTFAMAISVFCLTIFYGIRSKGVVNWVKGYLTHPFGKWLAPVNVIMSLVEEVAKPISLALRLFGNLFAGELVFMLIALVGFHWYMLPVQAAFGFAWTTFHLLIILIQSFIFMLLSVVYLALATSHDAH